MKKSILIIFLLVVCSVFVFNNNVNAKEIVYKNENGLELSKIEYENIINIHGKDYLDNMTQNDFLKYQEYYDSQNLKIEKSTIPTYSIMSSNFHETTSKKLSVYNVTNSSPTTLVVVNLEWKQIPKVKSYDVIGVRLYNTNFVDTVDTYALINGANVNPSATKQTSNGFGASIKLPSNSSSIQMQQCFTVNSGGVVFASYQHAVKEISLSESQDFTISSVGLGKVFKFSNISLFDQMDGVSINT